MNASEKLQLVLTFLPQWVLVANMPADSVIVVFFGSKETLIRPL